MTAQDIFNQVVYHLRQQGRRAVDNAGNCVYLGIDGSRCAVGCLVPDEHYDRLIEGVSIFNVINRPEAGLRADYKILKRILKKLDLWEHRSLLIDLQRVHDF